MKKIGGILTMMVFAVLLMSCVNAFAYTINDDSSATLGNLYSGDRIGNYLFEIYGMDVTQSGSLLTFDIYSNFPGVDPVGGWTTYPADLGIDVDNNGSYEYGVAFVGNRDNKGLSLTPGSLYSVNTSLTNTTSYISNGWYTSRFYEPTNSASGDHFIYHEGMPVAIAGYNDVLSSGNVTWDDISSTYPNYKISTTIDASKILASGFDGNITVYYGGATCANDYVKGTVHVSNPVPEPATCSLLGLGLVGLLSRFRRKKA